jgi:uncharacterized membrane protein YjgN (DUF898 family)
MAEQQELNTTEGSLGPLAPGGVGTQTLGVRFTGSGSEYLRIWIVNLLLTLVTLTLYWPFARARRLAYFQNNTLVGGDPLGFHGDPWKMFRGYLLTLLFGFFYWLLSKFAPTLQWLPLLVVALLWPALWLASLQFRLRNTSWRGVRMSFEGDRMGAYLCMVPVFIPGLALALLASNAESATGSGAGGVLVAVTGLTLLAFVVLLPWLLMRIKRYQHGGYAFAQERMALVAGAGAFYALSLRVAGVFLLCMAALFALGGILLAASGSSKDTFVSFLPFLLLLGYLLFPLVLIPYVTSRLQNLLWTHTSSQRVRFHSQLKFPALVGLTAKNWLFLLLTLGLYWPFAKVHTARMRLEAMTLAVQGDVNEWLAQMQGGGQGILGDAAGDFLGIDMGL